MITEGEVIGGGCPDTSRIVVQSLVKVVATRAITVLRRKVVVIGVIAVRGIESRFGENDERSWRRTTTT